MCPCLDEGRTIAVNGPRTLSDSGADAMFTVTGDAACQLAERLSNTRSPHARAFTFAREDHGWRLQLSERLEGEVVIRHEDRIVLVLDREAADRLADRRLELDDTGSGRRLRMPSSRNT